MREAPILSHLLPPSSPSSFHESRPVNPPRIPPGSHGDAPREFAYKIFCHLPPSTPSPPSTPRTAPPFLHLVPAPRCCLLFRLLRLARYSRFESLSVSPLSFSSHRSAKGESLRIRLADNFVYTPLSVRPVKKGLRGNNGRGPSDSKAFLRRPWGTGFVPLVFSRFGKPQVSSNNSHGNLNFPALSLQVVHTKYHLITEEVKFLQNSNNHRI